MWNNSLWEQEHQEKLKKDYLYELIHSDEWEFASPVRRIICEGCGNVFYTRVKVKKYCNENCAKKGFWKHKRQRSLEKRKDVICKTCGKTFTPKRSDGIYCNNACRQKAYRQGVADKSTGQKCPLISADENTGAVTIAGTGSI